jgi:hypothetical protein
VKLESLGFWFNEHAPGPYPRPQALVGAWDPDARRATIDYLAAGLELVEYRGCSHCRFGCEELAGHCDFSDGTWVWPEGLAHYVAQHDVQLPERFIARALARAGAVAPVELPDERDVRVDDGPWLAWARARGACLDLTGWEVPGAEDRAKITAALGREADIRLARGDTREVVIRLASGALEIVQLRAGGHPPRTLAGWHEWPVLRPA